jgi:hypothetical protein
MICRNSMSDKLRLARPGVSARPFLSQLKPRNKPVPSALLGAGLSRVEARLPVGQGLQG